MLRSTLPRPAAPESTGPTASPVLWLVRHGESTWNTLGLAQGHRDEARLTRRGVRQARIIAYRLGGRPVRQLFASDLRRAMQTAAPLALSLGLAIARDSRLRERSLGILEGTATAAISPASNGLDAGRVVDPDVRPAGGESVRDLYRRVAAFTDELTLPYRSAAGAPPGEVVVVAHGGTLRVLDAYLHQVPVERMRWAPLTNASILQRQPTIT
jgi:broad specificity phosphatase PhoE